MSVTDKLMFVNFVDDVSLADEETNSIPTDNAKNNGKGILQKKHFGFSWDFGGGRGVSDQIPTF